MTQKKLTAANLAPVPERVPDKLANEVRVTHDQLRDALLAAESAEANAASLRKLVDSLTLRYDQLLQEAGGQGRLALD